MMAATATAEQEEWLTTILRPAGSLDRTALARLCETLAADTLPPVPPPRRAG